MLNQVILLTFLLLSFSNIQHSRFLTFAWYQVLLIWTYLKVQITGIDVLWMFTCFWSVIWILLMWHLVNIYPLNVPWFVEHQVLIAHYVWLNKFFREHIAIFIFKLHVLATSSSLNNRSASFVFEAKTLFTLVKIIIHHCYSYK